MRKWYLLFLAALFLVWGCDEDVIPPTPDEQEEVEEDDGKGPAPGAIWDFASWSVEVNVTDQAGNDLLAGNLGTGASISYKEKSYPATLLTRAYLAPWSGLVLYQPKGELATLIFGEFPPGGYQKEPLTLRLGDGTTLNLAFDLYITWKDHEPTVWKRGYLNGQKMTDWQAVGNYRVQVKMAPGKSLTGY